MFARRGFNIHSLAVGPTVDPLMSLITIVVDGPEMEQIIKQLYKLVNTVKVTELGPGEGVVREIMLVRVNSDPANRAEMIESAAIFEATPVDVGATTITFELSGEPEQLANFLELMRPYGIVDLAKSGRIALPKDSKARQRAAAAVQRSGMPAR
jgi:acetolactate synthase-1/3 small subunit